MAERARHFPGHRYPWPYHLLSTQHGPSDLRPWPDPLQTQQSALAISPGHDSHLIALLETMRLTRPSNGMLTDVCGSLKCRQDGAIGGIRWFWEQFGIQQAIVIGFIGFIDRREPDDRREFGRVGRV